MRTCASSRRASLEEDGTVASRWTACGTHRGADFMGLPATGRRLEITGISMYRVKYGKIAEGWVNDDNLGMARQLGLLPA